jgi:hypothetical protein
MFIDEHRANRLLDRNGHLLGERRLNSFAGITNVHALATDSRTNYIEQWCLGFNVFCISVIYVMNRVFGLVVRVLGYRSGGSGSIPGTTRKENGVALERGPLSLASTTE